MSRINLDGHALDTFALHDRRLHLTNHPDAEQGQFVLVAAYGEGTGAFGGRHELCLCFDQATRERLIASLQSEPEDDCVPPVCADEAPQTPRTASPDDAVVRLRVRPGNLEALERGVKLGRTAEGMDITARLVRQGADYVLEMTGPAGAAAEVPEPVDFQQIGEQEVATCFVCRGKFPAEEVALRRFPVAMGRWTGSSQQLVCVRCQRKLDSDSGSRRESGG